VAVNPAGTRVYVANSIANNVSVIDTASNTVTATVAVGTSPGAFGLFIGGAAGPSPPTITNGPPPNGTVGAAYSFTYTSTGSPTFSVTAGSLPPGLSLSSAGVISGTPTTAGTFSGTVTATNGTAPDATQNFSITIVAVATPPTITNGPPPNGTVGVVYSFTYTSTGAPTFSVTAGSLPPGLSLSSAGVISGTPTIAGTFSGTVTATNGTAPDATQNFSITIVAVAPPPGPAANIPTLSEWGMAFLVLLIAGMAWFVYRKKGLR
jgi:YVTN family beta-propeller protein